MNVVMFRIPVEVVSEANQRGNWKKHWPRKKAHRKLARTFAERFEWTMGDYPWRVTLVRIKGTRQRDFDDDNLRSSFKSIRDGIADAIGVDDGSKQLTWEYRQEKGERAGVRVEIREMG